MEKTVRGIDWNTEIVQQWTFEHFKKVISNYRIVNHKEGINYLVYEDVSEEDMKKDFTELTGKIFETETSKKKLKKDNQKESTEENPKETTEESLSADESSA